MMKSKLTYPFRYVVNYATCLFNYLCVSTVRGLTSEERLADTLLMQGLEWKPCNSCGYHFLFHTPLSSESQYCGICIEHNIFYQCVECDRRIYFDNRRNDVRVIDAMFCEYHIGDVRKEILDANQMFINFKKVNAVSSAEEFAKIHEGHKKDFHRQLSILDELPRLTPDKIKNDIFEGEEEIAGMEEFTPEKGDQELLDSCIPPNTRPDEPTKKDE